MTLPLDRKTLLPLALLVGLGGLAAAQGKADGPRFSPAERRQMEEVGAEVTKHLVRVRIELQPVIHRVDGLKIDRPWVLEGLCGGLVVSPDPLVLISASSCRLDHAGMITGLASSFRDPPKRRYTLLFNDGSEVTATIVRHDRSVNVFVLRPAPEATLPEELPTPISFEGMARPTSGQMLGLAAFIMPQNNARTRLAVTAVPPDKDRYARPVLLAAGLHQLGMPVIFSDGRLAGIVNLPPPEGAAPRPRVDIEALKQTDGTRDPMEWASGYRRPVLMSEGDLAPFVEALYAPTDTAVSFEPLGLRLLVDRGQLWVGEVTAGGPAARAGIVSSERIVRVGDREVRSVDDFTEALADALTEDTAVRLVVQRDGRDVELVLDVE